MRVLRGLAAVWLVGFGMVCVAQDGGGKGPVRVAGGVIAGQIVSKVAPVYPADAKAEGVSGVVVLHAVIGKNGTIENLSVVSGPELLQASAMDAVRLWRYQPYLLNGEPVSVDTTITVNYQLAGPEAPAADEVREPQPGGVRVMDGDVQVVRMSTAAMESLAITKVSPKNPTTDMEGTVVLKVLVGTNGSVKQATLMSGPEIFKDAAMAAVRDWKYRPFLLNGEPVEVETSVVMKFER